MTQERKHSPLPWKVSGQDLLCVKENNDLLAEVYSPVDQFVTPEANAAFIVLACNSHYDLVEALNNAVTDLYDGIPTGSVDAFDVIKLIERVRKDMAKALAEAEAA